VPGVDLRHDERHVRVHPERPGVVHDDGAAFRGGRCPDGGDLVGHVEHRHVGAVEDLLGQLRDLHLRAADRELPAR
jgi:hypothetical protein